MTNIERAVAYINTEAARLHDEIQGDGKFVSEYGLSKVTGCDASAPVPPDARVRLDASIVEKVREQAME